MSLSNPYMKEKNRVTWGTVGDTCRNYLLPSWLKKLEKHLFLAEEGPSLQVVEEKALNRCGGLFS